MENRVITQFELMIRGLNQLTDLSKAIGQSTTNFYELNKASNMTANSLVKDAAKSAAVFDKQISSQTSALIKEQQMKMKTSNLDQKNIVDSIKLQEKRAKINSDMANEEFRSIRDRLSMQGKEGLKQQKVDLGLDNIKLANELMKESGLSANDLSIALKRMGLSLKGGKIFNSFNEEVKKSSINMRQLRKNAVRFDMSLLSVMFAAMAVQRATMQMMRSFITTYQKANEGTEGLGKSTWELQAAWEFLKYSIIDALTQSPLFKMLVQWLLNIVQWFNKLSPTQKTIIGISLAVLYLVSTLFFLYAQLGLAIVGFKGMGIAGGVAGAEVAAGGATASLAWWQVGLIIIAVGLVVWGLVEIFTAASTDISKKLDGLALVALGIGVAAIAVGAVWIGVFALIVAVGAKAWSYVIKNFDAYSKYFVMRTYQDQQTYIAATHERKMADIDAAKNHVEVWNKAIDIVTGFIKGVVDLWNSIRAAFGKKPINVDVTGLEGLKKTYDYTSEIAKENENFNKSMARSSREASLVMELMSKGFDKGSAVTTAQTILNGGGAGDLNNVYSGPKEETTEEERYNNAMASLSKEIPNLGINTTQFAEETGSMADLLKVFNKQTENIGKSSVDSSNTINNVMNNNKTITSIDQLNKTISDYFSSIDTSKLPSTNPAVYDYSSKTITTGDTIYNLPDGITQTQIKQIVDEHWESLQDTFLRKNDSTI